MLLTFLLFFLLWSLGPGLLALWVCREGRRSPLAGFLSGLILGPFGVVAALLLVKLAGRAGAPGGGQTAEAPVRLSYKVPVVGRLHVSTVWALAGLATFICAWGVGGLGYEVLYPSPPGAEASERAGVAGGTGQTGGAGVSQRPATGADALPTDAQTLQANLARTQMPPASFLDSLANRSKQAQSAPAQVGAAVAGTETLAQAAPNDPPAAQPEAPAQQNSPAPAPINVAPTPTAAQPPAPASQSAVGEVIRLFGSNGHRVHASLSGAGRATTLSVSGPTLTRAAGSQLLGNGRVREALKASGVRVVVLVNGADSWTFLL
ncbi:MAG TPA: hypothetical protein VEY09_10025 [Pyrinomonadaceae bacterium]|nr:hypothetical protein [Pyrinomonadaceae bacterium]